MFRLHFPDSSHPDAPLQAGWLLLNRRADGALSIGSDVLGLSLARLSLDHRGVWLQVLFKDTRIHLNGRPVRRMAQLRSGDVMFVDGIEVRLCGRWSNGVAPINELTTLLRAHGGRLHGRAFAISKPVLIGSDITAGIPLSADHPAQTAKVFMEDGELRVIRLDAAAVLRLNGEPCQQAILQTGDQLSLGTECRLVVESAGQANVLHLPVVDEILREAGNSSSSVPPARSAMKSVPWLLLASLVLSGLLGLLLLYGAH